MIYGQTVNIILVTRAMSGDSSAKSQLLTDWYTRVYNYALKFLGDHDLAMEVSQLTFIAVHHKIETLQDPEKFRSWLYTILANNCRHQKRRRKDPAFSDLSSEAARKAMDLPCNNTNPEQQMIQQEAAFQLQQAILRLPEVQREVLIMKEFEGLKFREIAESLGISENTAKSRLYYAFKHLKETLSGYSYHPK
ncbi:MAG: RNA polymerase sigma factor [Lunatimonas sp.]|uniref:RNA polymerase sigma factor n=1 Tax=Lunatimonas sp. TaxID=2060141 RepID=UPI00263B7687|nr:RNA polymerase sigma factor [Lunatimonas sp.]MCC5937722.1 RNA polymerase sigma factor [Lunatimonas sp.]